MARLSAGVGDDTPTGRIKRIMVLRNVSLKALSEETGIPYPTLQANLAKVNSIKIDTLSAICKALDISADYILDGDAAHLNFNTVRDALDLTDQLISLGVQADLDQRAQMFIDSYGFAFRCDTYPDGDEFRDFMERAKSLLKDEPRSDKGRTDK